VKRSSEGRQKSMFTYPLFGGVLVIICILMFSSAMEVKISETSLISFGTFRIVTSACHKTYRYLHPPFGTCKHPLAEFYLFLIRSSIVYMPGCLSCKNTAAFNEPSANMYFDVAVCFISIISSLPAKITECSPTMVPPLTACIPISFLFLFFFWNACHKYTHALHSKRNLLHRLWSVRFRWEHQFLVVVLFDDFYVKIAFKHFCRFFYQVQHEVYTY